MTSCVCCEIPTGPSSRRVLRTVVGKPESLLRRGGPRALPTDDLAEVLAHRGGIGRLAERGKTPGVLDGAQQAVMRFVGRRAKPGDRVGRNHQGGDVPST